MVLNAVADTIQGEVYYQTGPYYGGNVVGYGAESISSQSVVGDNKYALPSIFFFFLSKKFRQNLIFFKLKKKLIATDLPRENAKIYTNILTFCTISVLVF